MVPNTSPFAPLFLAALLALAGAAGAAPAAPVVVPTVEVAPAGAAAAFELDGSLQALRQATLGAQVGGSVVALLVKAGDSVKAGQPLVRIDERDSAAGLLRGDAGVAQAEAEFRNAETAARRTRELRAQGFVSPAALDVAETQLKAAQAGLQQAQAARAQAALAKSFATVTAPFDARVQATHVEAGDLATPGRALVTVFAPGALRAVVQLPASRSAAARGASGVQVQLPDGRWVVPTAKTELPSADAVSQTVEWRLDLPRDAVAGLAPGQNVRARFTGAANASTRPSVPASAVLVRGELTAVYVLQNHRFVLKPVRLGASLGDRVEVLAGLKAGERVAAEPVRAGLAEAVAQR